jgi:hypothetical protein
MAALSIPLLLIVTRLGYDPSVELPDDWD